MNITPEQIADAIAEILEGAERQGVVVTDKKLAQSNGDLSRLLKSHADKDEWKGWIFTWLGMPTQIDEGDCLTETTYHFVGKFFHFYLDDYKEDLTTDLSFKRAIFEANEALNRKRDLDLGNAIRHEGLQSEGDFEIEDLGGGSVNQECHTAIFSLNVVATNTY